MLNMKFRVWDRTVKVMAKVNQINFHTEEQLGGENEK